MLDREEWLEQSELKGLSDRVIDYWYDVYVKSFKE